MVSLESAWSLYMAVRLHFLHDYDALKYQGRIAWADKLKDRPDKVLIRSALTDLPDKREVVEYCVANYLYENDQFLYGCKDDSDVFYGKWLKYWNASNMYHLAQEISYIEMQMMKHDVCIEEYLMLHIYNDINMNRVSRETLCCIMNAMPHSTIYIKGVGAERLLTRVQKTIPFIQRRLDETKSIVEKAFNL